MLTFENVLTVFRDYLGHKNLSSIILLCILAILS